MSSAQVRPISSTLNDTPIGQSASFAAHLKSIERKIPLRSPAHAAFGGYKISDIGRETHKMMLDLYQQTKNVLVSYGTKALGFF